MIEHSRHSQIYAVVHSTDRIFVPDGNLPNCPAEPGKSWEQQIASHLSQRHRLGVSTQNSLGFYGNNAGYLMRLSSGVETPPADPEWLHSRQAIELLTAGPDEIAAYFAKAALTTFAASRRLDIIG